MGTAQAQPGRRRPADEGRATGQQVGVLVLGMHRSGTSALTRLLALHGIALGEIAPETDPDTASILFIGLIQGIVMQSMLAGDPKLLKAEAPKVFAIYRRGLEAKR